MALPHEEKPLGLQVPPVQHGVEIPPEPPDVGARALAVGARLLAGATTFFFLSFLFAYFYLRSIDASHVFRPKHVNPSTGLGIAFIVCLLISLVLAVIGGRGMKARQEGWTLPVGGAVIFGLATVALQCIEYTTQGFGPTDGAYASVFCAWTGFFSLATLGVMYWLETQVATEVRARHSPSGHGDIKDPDRLIAPGLDASVFYWGYLAAIGVITYVVLYVL
jgi:heme/copper-type cytochrome/quinol oxidase subunit 3